jgi:hypothetical protein
LPDFPAVRSPEVLAAARCRARFPDGLAGRGEVDFIRARAWMVRQRRQAAAGYVRDLDRLQGHVMGAPCPPGLSRDLLARPDDPAVTWRLIRLLCAARRYLSPSVAARYNLGCLGRDSRIEVALAGEIGLWRKARARDTARRAA